jgi:hypothetical protein
MARSKLTREQVKAAVLAELSTIDCDPLDPRDLHIVGAGAKWRPMVRHRGSRIDEAQLAMIYEIGQRLVSGYDLAG